MQSLWSKVGQAHRCGCGACAGALNGASRRVTTAASRRKPTFTEVFTACYSSMFATAAIIDAVRKDDRRRELDRQLDEARQQLAALESDRTSGVLAMPTDLTIDQMDVLWRSMKEIWLGRPFMKEIHQPVSLQVSELLSRVKLERYGGLGEITLNEWRGVDWQHLERALIGEQENPALAQRGPKNEAQLSWRAASVRLIVDQLLRRASCLGPHSKKTKGDSARQLEETRVLLQQGLPSYKIHNKGSQDAHSNSKRLNGLLRSIINAPNLDPFEKVGRVCFNLLNSKYPIDTHTYNTLITAFDRNGYSEAAEVIVNDFFYNQRLLPTPSTFVAVLNHEKMRGNHGRFLRMISCLTGLDRRTGAKVKKRHLQRVTGYHHGLDWAQNSTLRTISGKNIYEHAPLSSLLAEELINGLLRFKLFPQAAEFFISCLEAGLRLASKTVLQVMEECINALDLRMAVRLVRSLTSKPNLWANLLQDRNETVLGYMAHRIEVLFDLVGVPSINKGISGAKLESLGIQSKDLDHLANVLQRLRAGISTGAIGDIMDENAFTMNAPRSRLLRIESLWKDHAFVENTTRSIESKLLGADCGLAVRTYLVQHISEEALQRSQWLMSEAASLLDGRATNDSQVESVQVEQEEEMNIKLVKEASDSSVSPAPIRRDATIWARAPEVEVRQAATEGTQNNESWKRRMRLACEPGLRSLTWRDQDDVHYGPSSAGFRNVGVSSA